ncbi:MAG: hypothetical protein WCI18_12805 [Pseudomonadota bacterium]
MPPTRQHSSAIWLSTMTHAYQKVRAEALFIRGVQVEFMQTIGELKAFLRTKRVSVIIVSDDCEDAFLETYFKPLTALPDTAGARLILDQTCAHAETAALALANGFRDILPATLDAQEWLARFMFSAAVSPFRLNPPHCQLAMNQRGSLEIPACLVSISEATLRLESRLQAEPGSEISLRGELPLLLGKEVLRGTVLSTDTKKLLHKLSHSLDVELDLDHLTRKELSDIVTRMQKQITFHPKRIFVVVSHSDTRFQVLEHFQKEGHIVRCAINRSSVYEYPKFFSPELVVIESRFCRDENQDLFEKLIENISPEVLVAIIGDEKDHLSIVAKFNTNKFKFVSKNLNDFMSLPRELSPDPHPLGRVDLPTTHPLVPLTILAPIVLSRLHTQVGEFRSNLLISNFSLARLHTPEITKAMGRAPIIKITAVSQSQILAVKDEGKANPLPCKYMFYFADLTTSERSLLNFYMSREFSTELSRFGRIPETMRSDGNQGYPSDSLPNLGPTDPSDIDIIEEKLGNYIPSSAVSKPFVVPKWIQAILLLIGVGIFIWAAMTIGFVQMETVGDKYSKPFVNFKNQKELEKRGLLPVPANPAPSPFDTAMPPGEAPQTPETESPTRTKSETNL